MKKLIIISAITFTLFGAFTTRQLSANKLAATISQFFEKRPMEKIFLHLDKAYYASGDEIWYSAYINDYLTGRPSNLSEILHVELFDRNGKSLLQQKIIIANGYADGFIELPDTLGGNYYALKAYTNWSRNFEEGLLFNHPIKIVTPNFQAEEATLFSNVQFFPEGGRILNNKLNNVAFKTDKKARSRAYLIDNENDTLYDFDYEGNGFGLLRVLPNSTNARYRLKFEDEEKYYSIPTSRAEGTTLRLKEKKDVFNVFLEGSDKYTDKEVSVIVLNNGNVVSALGKLLNPAGLFLVFRKSDLPYGLNHLMIYSDNNELLNQRLFYHSKPNEESLLKIRMGKEFKVRNPIDISVVSGHQATANVSVSVTPVKFFNGTEKPNIIHSSQKMQSASKDFSLNQYLITQDINTYDPETIISDKEPSFEFEIQQKEFFQVNVDVDMNKSFDTDDTYFSLSLKNGDSINLYFSKMREDKNLTMTIPSFYGLRDMSLLPYQLDQDLKISYSLNKSIGNELLKMPLYTQSEVETAYAKQVRENKATKRLYNIDYKMLNKPGEISSSRMAYTYNVLNTYDESIVLRDYIPLPNMKEVFKELLQYARLKETKNGDFKIQLNDKSGLDDYDRLMENEPLRLIDGVPINDSKVIADLKPSTVKSINMICQKITLDSVEMDGVFHVITDEGIYGKTNDVGQGVFTFPGYSDQFSFNCPDLNATTPDFRSTLYWNPYVLVEENGSTNISFPASDEPGKYKVEIQGLTEDGLPIHSEAYFTVLPK